MITYDHKYKESFKALNSQWIEKYFQLEKKDLEQMQNPEECLATGGQIFFILIGEKAAGTCGVYEIAPDRYEIAKMAVNPEFQGQGLGDLLIENAEDWAKSQGAKEILLLSNTILTPAIRLYKKHGYQVTHWGPDPDYERCNIELRKFLTGS